jgi:hypothetical protein
LELLAHAEFVRQEVQLCSEVRKLFLRQTLGHRRGRGRLSWRTGDSPASPDSRPEGGPAASGGAEKS